jgi:rubrerythrin
VFRIVFHSHGPEPSTGLAMDGILIANAGRVRAGCGDQSPARAEPLENLKMKGPAVRPRPQGDLKANMFSMSDIIDLAIQIETNAESVYRSALGKISDPALITILRYLANEEIEHAKWFRQLRETTASEIKDPAVEALGKSLLSDVLGRQSFSLKEADFSKINQLEELLSLAIEFEKDKVIFYNMLRQFIEDDETLDFLGKIIDEETHHIQELNRLLDRDDRDGQIATKT